MTQTSPTQSSASGLAGRRADALADRLEQGAKALTDFAASLTSAQWTTRCMPDGRTVGVIVHHVGFVYPIEIDIARPLSRGEALTGLTMDDVHAMNAKHAIDFAGVTKEQAIDLVRTNSAAAAAAIRALSDEQSPRPRRHPSTGTRRSRASSFSRTTPCGTAITISPA